MKTRRLNAVTRILMVLFAMMLFPQGTWAQYDLKIGNQEFSGSGITDLSALSEFAGVITGGSVVYNHNSHTLSLNGATISGSIVWNYQDNLNIELEGDNVLTGRIIANNSYTLTFIKSSASTGNCSLTISSGAVAAATSAISGFSDVWYKHVYLDSAYPVAYDGSQMKMLDYQYPNSPSDASSISLKSDHVYHRIWVNGTQLTDLNLSPMAPNLVYSGSPDSDDGGTRTLTLNNYTANGSIVSDLPNLTIQFVGTNKINTDGQSNSSFGAADNAIFSCNPSATLTFQKNGDGTLELDGKDTPKSAIAGFASVNYGDGCYLKADKPTKYSSDDKCYINFANGNAPVDVVTISTDVYYPLWIGTSTTAATQVANTTITAGVTAGTVTFTPAIGTTSSKLTLSDATIEAKILSALGNLVIDVTGTNTITSPDSGTVIRSVNEGTLTLERAASIASLELKTNLTDNTKPVIQGFHTLSYNTSFDLNTSATTSTYGIFYSMYGLFDDGPGGIFAIMQATFAKNYGLSIAGTPVTSANAGNVFAGDATYDGKVIFTPDASTANSGTLTLNGMSKDGKIVSNLANLTIELKGDNALTGTSGYIESQNTSASLTIKKGANDSKLSLTNSTGPSAVSGFASVTLEDVYLSASGCCTYDGSSKAYKYPATDAVGAFNVQDLTFTTAVYYPLWVGSTQVSASNMNDLWDDGKASFASGSNTLILKELSIDSSNGIESALPNLTILLDGNNSINTNTAYHWNPIYSADGNATLTIQKAATATACSLTLSTSAGNVQVVKGFSSVSHTGLDLNVTAGTGTTLDAATTYGATLSISAYPVWIGSKQVNVANAADVLSDGTVSYVHDATNNTGTLTLNNAQLVGDIATSMSNLTIHIKGGCQIIAKSNCIRSSATTPGTLTFTREDAAGELTLNNMNAVDPNNPSNTKSMSAIKGFSTLAGLPLVTQEPYEIDAYYRLKKTLSSDTSTVDCAWVNADTTYPVWVNGKQVTSENKTNVLEAATATVTFDGANTLTLDGASITTNEGYGVVTGNDLTVKLAGSNSITCDNAADFAFKGYNTGAAAPTVTIGTDTSNPGSLTLNLKTSGNLFSNVTPNFINDLTRFDDGSNGTYYVTRIIPVTNYNLWVGSTRVTSANAADVLPTGSTAGKVKYAHDATNNTGTLTLDNVTLDQGIYTTMADLTIHINGSCQISPSATKNSNCIMSTANNGILTFTKESGGKLILNNGAQHYSPIRGFGSLAGVPLETTKPYELETTIMGYYRLKDKMASDTASVELVYIGADTTYPLWVSGVQVTSANNGNVFNDGTISFGSNTLTLNGANIPASIVSDIPSLTISLLKDNTVSDGILSTDATTSLTIAKDATATGDVSLLAKTGTGSAIKGFSNISYTGLTPFSVDASDNPVTDITSSMTYTGNALKLSGSDLSAVYFGIPTDLESTSYSYSMGSKTYDGSAVVLPGTVTMNDGTKDITLTENTDYTVTGYKDSKKTALTTGAPKDAGSYYATIQGKNGYSGTVDVPFTIDAITASLSWDTTTQLIYNGTPQAPAVSVSNLLSGESCTVTVTGQQTNAGTSYTATATSLGNSNYQLPTTGLTQTFNIDQLDLSTSTTLSIGTIDNQTYSGSNIEPKPAVSITLGTITTPTTLKAEDFDYSYANNKNAASSASTSAPTVTITGKGNYKGSSSKTFTILPKSIASAVITLSSTSSAFNGDTQAPTISSVSLDNVPLTPDVDYTVKSNAGGKDVGTYDVVIQGKGNYDAATTAKATFTIVPCSVAVVTIDAIPAQTYNGSPINPVPTGFIMSGTNKISLVVGTDFDCTSYANNTNAALSTDTPAPTVTITCKGNYYGTKDVPFTIDPVDLSKSTDITIDAVPDQIYTGSPITPTPEVKFNGNKLTAGTDFNYSYSNNTDEAQSTSSPAPTVTVTGMGNFKNSISVKFTIEQEASIAFGTRNYITYHNDYTGNRLVPNNAKAYIVTGVNGNEVIVEQVSYIAPNTSVLMEKSPGWTNVKDNKIHSGNLLKHATAGVNTDGKQYVLYSNEFVKATGTIPVGKNYLDLSSLVSPARTLVISTNNTTAIDAIFGEDADGEDKWYDMQGRQINKPTKAGLYIRNGKKVVVNNK